MLEGFKQIQIVQGSAFLSVTNNGLGFNKNIIVKMDKPRFVAFFLNKEKKQLAIQKSDEQDDYAIKFYDESMDIKNGIRCHNRDLEHTIESLMCWDLSTYNYRIDGYYMENESAMLFDLQAARVFNKKSRAK